MIRPKEKKQWVKSLRKAEESLHILRGLSLQCVATKVEKHSLNSRMEQKIWLKANMKLLFLKSAGHAPGLVGVETAGWCEL